MLRTFKAAAPKFLMLGSYPKGQNSLVSTGAYFPINLMREPFSLWPTEIHAELSRDWKHMLVYTPFDLGGWDLDAVEARVEAMSQ